MHYFASFGGPTENYHRRVETICRQMSMGFPHFRIFKYTDDDLRNDPEFWNKHEKFMDSHPRGYGHWLWKPWLIHKTMQSLQDDDILIYADAGCTINHKGSEKLNEYIKMVQENEFGLLLFTLTDDDMHSEHKWTKATTLSALHATLEDTYSKQLMATVMIIKKTSHTTSFVKDWYDLCSNYILIDDTLTNHEHPEFNDHRHDQSVFSLLVKKCLRQDVKPVVIPDETYFWPNWHIDGINYPIWATRFRH
jgi:hypothetical protein